MNRHATTIEWNGSGIMLCGPPGCGKSELAFTLMRRGARLVADDQTLLHQKNNVWIATCPPPIRGMLHLRDTGILRVTPVESAEIKLIFQSVLPAHAISSAPDLGLPVIRADFKDANIVNFVENALSSVIRGFDTVLPNP